MTDRYTGRTRRAGIAVLCAAACCAAAYGCRASLRRTAFERRLWRECRADGMSRKEFLEWMQEM